MKTNSGLALFSVAAVWGLTWGGGPDYANLDSDAEPVKSAFNADAGKVRIVMLVAPT